MNRKRINPNRGGGLWEQRYIFFFPFSLFLSVYAYASVCDLVCIALLLPLVLGFCLSVFFVFVLFITFQKIFPTNYFLSYILITLFYFILLYFILSSSFFLFFLPFILSHVDDRLFVLQPGIRAVPLRWESQVQDTGTRETSQLYIISNGKNLPKISISTPRPSSTQRPASYSAGHPMPNN